MVDLLDKVIKGLRCHSEPKFELDEYFCETCPYDELTCGLDVPADALKLLKAQEPRLLKEADFVNADRYGYIPAWAEEKNGDQYWKTVRATSLGLDKKRLRYWTSRPTEEQREATPWEPPKEDEP